MRVTEVDGLFVFMKNCDAPRVERRPFLAIVDYADIMVNSQILQIDGLTEAQSDVAGGVGCFSINISLKDETS